jgi:hypothetical protein
MSTLKQQIKVERSKYTEDPLPTYQKTARAENIDNAPPPHVTSASSGVSAERRELTLSGILEGTRGGNRDPNPLMSQYDAERNRSNHRPLSDPTGRGNSDHPGYEKRGDHSRNLLGDERMDEIYGSRSSRSSAESNQSRPSMSASHHTFQSQQPPAASSSLQRVQYRMRNAVSSEIDERKRRSQAGKLGPRLATASNIVSHNAAMVSASRSEAYGGGPSIDDEDSNDLASTNESEANGSFRSAATVGSIPPHVSTNAKLNHSQFAKTVVSDLGVEGHQAVAAMSVIDRVTNITDDQLRRLDAETREQV